MSEGAPTQESASPNPQEFRAAARKFAQQARLMLASSDELDYPCIALKLRLAFEALVFECAADMRSDLTDDELRIWRPRILMRKLLDLNPLLGLDFEFQFEPKKAEEWISLGTMRNLSLKDVKNHYQRLSKLIHHYSLQAQLSGERPSERQLKLVCEQALEKLDHVLSSSMRCTNFDPHGRIRFNCVECEAEVTRSLTSLFDGPISKSATVRANCTQSGCRASYTIKLLDDKVAGWAADQEFVNCASLDCEGTIPVWFRDFRDGAVVTCPTCRSENVFKRCLTLVLNQ